MLATRTFHVVHGDARVQPQGVRLVVHFDLPLAWRATGLCRVCSAAVVPGRWRFVVDGRPASRELPRQTRARGGREAGRRARVVSETSHEGILDHVLALTQEAHTKTLCSYDAYDSPLDH